MKLGVLELIVWPISGNPLRYKDSFRGFTPPPILLENKDQVELLYNSLFAKLADWYQQWDRDPITGPIKDVINFLAELY